MVKKKFLVIIFRWSSLSTMKRSLLRISQEVRQALFEKRPVVSLESTIISHGLPYPQNIEMAKSVEQVLRDNGVVPATCAFIDGVPHVGLDNFEQLRNAVKVSRRDIGYVMANKLNGGTTIALTMILSHLAGIKVFATGGLGGVHRDGQYTMDVSADLTELGRTPVSVVCAGPKSILDIGLTMEYLETQGVLLGRITPKRWTICRCRGFIVVNRACLRHMGLNRLQKQQGLVITRGWSAVEVCFVFRHHKRLPWIVSISGA